MNTDDDNFHNPQVINFMEREQKLLLELIQLGRPSRNFIREMCKYLSN